MVEFRLVHSVTTEMCTGFLTLASIGILLKFLSDIYMKHFYGRVRLFDNIATITSRYAEPASYFALGIGIFMTFVSMVTGTLSWSIDTLMNSELVHNKVFLTVASQALYIGVFLIRIRHKYEIWMDRQAAWIYFLMTMTAFAFIILQNSVAGQMVGKGSLLDGTFPWLKELEFHMLIFPIWGSLLMILGTAAIVAVAFVLTRSKGEKREPLAA